MSYYQLTQLQLAGLSVVLVLVLLGYSLLKGRSRVPHATLLGVLIGILAACFFAVSYLTADSSLPRMTQVAVKLLRDLPTVLTVCYACMVQAKLYSLVRDESPALRRWFGRSWWVILAAFVGSGTLEFVLRPPVLESDQSLPSPVLVADATVLLPLAAYAALSSSVFLRTLWRNMGASHWSPKVQNFCGGIALGGLAVLALHTLAWRAARVVVPEDRIDPIVEQLSTNQIVIVALVAASILVGLISYSSEDRNRTVADDVEEVLRAFEGITEKVASASVSAEGLNPTYAAMHRATEEDLLRLSSREKRLADSAFRALLVTDGVRGHSAQHPSPIRRDQLLSVNQFYEHQLADPVVADEVRNASSKRLPDTLLGLFAHPESSVCGRGQDDFHAVVKLLLAVVDRNERSNVRTMSSWAQLVYVALVDAGVLQHRRDGLPTFSGYPVNGTVVDAYDLAKYEVGTGRIEV